jgi:hypothetical protein
LIRFFIKITYENSWMNNQMNDTTGSGYYRVRGSGYYRIRILQGQRVRILQDQDTTGSGY